MKQEDFQKLCEEDFIAAQAMVVAMYVRNQIEDFHAENLTDAQMKELNPLIRNGIYTALTCLEMLKKPNEITELQRAVADGLLSFQVMLIPEYWEEPELTEEFWRTYEQMDQGQEGTSQ